MTRVLLFCPTVKLSRDTFESIHGLHFDGALDRMFTHDNPHGEMSGRNILHNYQKAERIVKAESYDYLLTVEDDMLIPPDALEKMIAVDADIVYGVYCFRKGAPLINISKPNDHMESYGLPDNLKAWRGVFGQVIECGGLGLGCTLIKRSVFDVLSFHSVSGHDSDTQLSLDARRLGLRQMCDTSVLCGHKRSNSVVIWPDRDGYKEYGTPKPLPTREVIALRPLVFWSYEEVVIRMQPGEQQAIDFEHAADFVAAGLVKYATVSA
jgi:hypothetical protein